MKMLDVLFCYFIVLGGVVGVSLAQEGGTPSMFEVINLSLNFPMLSERDFATDAKERTISAYTMRAWGRFYGGKCSKDADCAGGIAYCELQLNPQVKLRIISYDSCHR